MKKKQKVVNNLVLFLCGNRYVLQFYIDVNAYLQGLSVLFEAA